MIVHVNQLKFSGEDAWTTQFNLCSDLYAAWCNPELTEEEEIQAFKRWSDERLKLETGQY